MPEKPLLRKPSFWGLYLAESAIALASGLAIVVLLSVCWRLAIPGK